MPMVFWVLVDCVGIVISWLYAMFCYHKRQRLASIIAVLAFAVWTANFSSDLLTWFGVTITVSCK